MTRKFEIYLCFLMLCVVGTGVCMWGFYKHFFYEKYSLNSEMYRLCKKDGGEAIYQKIILSDEFYDSAGGLRQKFVSGDRNIILTTIGDKYFVKSSLEYIKDGDIEKNESVLIRETTEIGELKTGRVFGRRIAYSRVAGDFPYVGKHTQSSCPKFHDLLENKIFVKKWD